LDEVVDEGDVSEPTLAGPAAQGDGEAGAAADRETPVEPTSGGPAQPPEVGTTLHYVGDYELLRKLAQGGMGVVYRAWQLSLSRPVAVKLILAGQLASSDAVQRFRREAEAVARLEHPGIVPIYEIGHEQGHYFFSMPLIDGESLAQRVLQGPLPHGEAAVLVRKVAEAMAYAHAAGVVHRDLKPGNILVDRQGEPKVIDFGLARRVETDSTLTSTGMILGTPSYMSPEQAQGEGGQLGPLTDVYSLGAVLYCLLTGRPPFQAATPLDTVRQVVEREAVSVSALNPAVPLDLETICHKCLQKDPAKRYATAQALADDLGRWERGEPITARPVSTLERGWRWVRKNPVLASLIGTTVAAVLVGTGASMWFGAQARQEAAMAKQTLARSNYFLAQARWKEGRVAEARELLERVPEEYRNIEWGLANREFEGSELTMIGDSSVSNGVAYSPDGTRIVYGCYDGTLKVCDAATGRELQTLTGHEGPVNSVAYSPDGARIISASRDKTIKLWDATTGRELLTLTGHEGLVNSVAYSPDGTRIISASSDNTMKLWDATTGQELQALTGHELSVNSVAYSPDGTRIVSASSDKTLKVWNSATAQVLLTLRGPTTPVESVAFSPNGERFVSADDRLRVWNASTGQTILRLTGHTEAVSSVAYSPDGTRLISGGGVGVFDQGLNEVKIWDAATGQERQTLTGHTEGVSCVAYSPDGTRIVSGSSGDRIMSVGTEEVRTRAVIGSPDNTLKVWDAATGRKMLTLTGHSSGVTSVAWSPDGKRIVSGSGWFVASNSGEIKVWDAATGQQLHTLNQPTVKVSCVAYSPDGSWIVSGSSDSTLNVWDAATGRKMLTLTGHVLGVTSVACSPDGRRIISGSDDTTLKVWNAATGQVLLTLRGHRTPVKCVANSPDGIRIVSVGFDKKLKLWDAETGEELCTLTGHTGAVTDVCFSPDGTRIVSASVDGTIRFWDTSFYRPDERTLRYLAAPKPEWHRQQATLFETNNNLYAALFHRAWLLKIQSDDPQLHDDLHAAHDRWKATTEGKDIPLPPVVREMLAVPRGG
jgi:WD40 repeat protein